MSKAPQTVSTSATDDTAAVDRQGRHEGAEQAEPSSTPSPAQYVNMVTARHHCKAEQYVEYTTGTRWRAIWYGPGEAEYVTVVGIWREFGMEDHYQIEESRTGLPVSQVQLLERLPAAEDDALVDQACLLASDGRIDQPLAIAQHVR